MGDDAEDDALNSPDSDQDEWQPSSSHQSFSAHTSYTAPSAAPQLPAWSPASQSPPPATSAPAVERLVNGESRQWGLDHVNDPLLFPLNFNYPPDPVESPQPNPITAPSTVSESTWTGQSASYDSAPSATYSAPSVASWQPGAFGGYGYTYSGFDAAPVSDDPVRPLVFEEVFQYPPENTDSGLYETGYGVPSPSGGSSVLNFPVDVGTQPVYGSGWPENPSGFYEEQATSSHTSYQPPESSWHFQEPVGTTGGLEVPQGVSEPFSPSYIIQSRSGFLRGRYLRTKTSYTPDFPPPLPGSSYDVYSRAPAQAAASRSERFV